MVVWLKGTVVLFAIVVVAGPVACTIVLFSILDKFPVSEVIVCFSKGWSWDWFWIGSDVWLTVTVVCSTGRERLQL